MKWKVASSHRTHGDILERLSTDDDVKGCVVANPRTPVDVLVRLSAAKDMVPALASNPTTPHRLLVRFGADSAWGVRASVAGNLSTPIGTLILLASDDNKLVREQAQANPHFQAHHR